MKIVLMTRNEWPLLRDWTLYHGHIFDFSNLYILDGSDMLDILDFLSYAKTELGVNVLHSNASLNNITDEVNAIMWNLRNTADFLIKLDTDEFLALHDHTYPYVVMNRSVRSHLDQLPLHGRKLKVGWVSIALPSEVSCAHDEYVIGTTNFSVPQKALFKTFFPAWNFLYVDLGSHHGAVGFPHNSHDNNTLGLSPEDFVHTGLLIIHYHYACFETYIAKQERVLLSHAYIQATDDTPSRLQRLGLLLKKHRQFASDHKVKSYVSYLRDPGRAKRAYYRRFRELPTRVPKFDLEESGFTFQHNQTFESSAVTDFLATLRKLGTV